MGNALNSDFSATVLKPAPVAAVLPAWWRSGSWLLAVALLLLVSAGGFVFGDRIALDWADPDLMWAVPGLWLAGLIWKGISRG